MEYEVKYTPYENNTTVAVGEIRPWENTLVVTDGYFGKRHVLPGNFVYRDKANRIRRTSIERVIYRNPATIVVWDDGTKTVCKCYDGDTYNPETGLTVCILKKLCGASAVKETIAAWMPEADYKKGRQVVQTLKHVRAKVKK